MTYIIQRPVMTTTVSRLRLDLRELSGHRDRIGGSDRQALGASRGWVLAAASLAMAAVGANLYGYGVLAPRLVRANAWGITPVLWGFALWGTCNAVAACGHAVLRHHIRFGSKNVVVVGAALGALGLVTLDHVDNPALALVGYGVLSGVGTGLVHRGCLVTVAGWYPDQPARIAVASGAFACGAIPLTLVAALVPDLQAALDQAAFLSLVVVVACAALLDEAPEHWWPTHLDPRRWAPNPAPRLAMRQRWTAEVLRAPITAVISVGVSSVGLFDTAGLVLFGMAGGWSIQGAAVALVLFAAGSGTVRPFAVWAGGRVGGPTVVRVALCVGAVAQVALLGSGAHHLTVGLLFAAGCAGAAIGVWYALFPSLVRGSRGARPGLSNLWLPYSANAVGSLLGVGGGALLVARGSGYPPAFALSAVLLLAGAGLTCLPWRRSDLRQTSL